MWANVSLWSDEAKVELFGRVSESCRNRNNTVHHWTNATVVAPSCSRASARELKMKSVGWPEEGAAQGWQILSSFCKQKKFGLSDSCMKSGYCNPSQNLGDLIVIIRSLNGSQSFALLQTELVFPDVPWFTESRALSCTLHVSPMKSSTELSAWRSFRKCHVVSGQDLLPLHSARPLTPDVTPVVIVIKTLIINVLFDAFNDTFSHL